MAGNAARRIALVLATALLASFAYADWGSTHYCRLTLDRLVIFASGQRFVLTHAGAWELTNPKQKDAFDTWLSQSKLTKDLGQLVGSAPIDHAYPLAAEIDVRSGFDSGTSIVFRVGQDEPTKLEMTPVADGGVKLDGDGSTQFAAIAKKIGRPASTLLVAMADATSQVTETRAWGLFLDRLKSSSEFFVFVDKKLGVMWVRRLSAPPQIGTTNGSSSKPKDIAPTVKPKPKADSEGSTVDSSLWIPVVAALAGIGGGFMLGRKVATPKRKPIKEEPRFTVGAHERELVEAVRQEMARLRWGADHVPSAEEYVVGQMIDRFNRHETLAGQVEQLKSFKSFSEDHNVFQRRIDQAVAAAKASETKAVDLSLNLESVRSQLASLTEQLKTAQSENRSLVSRSEEAEKLLEELASWDEYVSKRLDSLVEQMQHE